MDQPSPLPSPWPPASPSPSPTLMPSPSLPSAPLPSHSPLPATQEEISASWAILILISILVTILLTSYVLQRRQIRFIHETVVSILLGSLVGAAIRFSPATGIQRMVTFDHRYFFNLLLPPIILHSGYDMKRRYFFKNFGSILIFAFIGTFVSTIIIGVLVYMFVLTGIHNLNMSFLDCFVFGAILSSTDPVTVLSIFNQLKVDPKLYAIIFGESLLNDSVAIVLFATLGKFQGKPLTVESLLEGAASFFAVFSGSVLIGVIIALICALLLKHTHLHLYPSLESCLVLLIAYSSYLLSNAIQLSGIVSLLFCGIILKHYAYDNMSLRGRRTTKYMFRVLSQMSENFVFIYLGVTLFTKTDEVFYPALILFMLTIIMFARYVSTVPLAELINLVAYRWSKRPRLSLSDVSTAVSDSTAVIPRNHQLMIWWAGLRGAIAFALAYDVEGAAGPVIRTTTLVVCVVSVVLLGGTTKLAIERLGIRTGVKTKQRDGSALDSDSSDEDHDDGGYAYGYVPSRYSGLGDGDDNDGGGGEWSSSRRSTVGGAERAGRGRPVRDSTDYDDDDDDNNTFQGGSAAPAADGHRAHASRSGSIDMGLQHLPLHPSSGWRQQHGRPPVLPTSATMAAAATVTRTVSDDDMEHWFLSFDARYLKPLFTQTGWTRRRGSRPLSRQQYLHLHLQQQQQQQRRAGTERMSPSQELLLPPGGTGHGWTDDAHEAGGVLGQHGASGVRPGGRVFGKSILTSSMPLPSGAQPQPPPQPQPQSQPPRFKTAASTTATLQSSQGSLHNTVSSGRRSAHASTATISQDTQPARPSGSLASSFSGVLGGLAGLAGLSSTSGTRRDAGRGSRHGRASMDGNGPDDAEDDGEVFVGADGRPWSPAPVRVRLAPTAASTSPVRSAPSGNGAGGRPPGPS
ncbi:Sodium/hydrogen exchanger family-domain-containing protein [Entophlyctis helioformis]|nr:Sodium/hydrogen exchanger family-domain-containing protein [Entophlyctis helioformis]